MEYIIVAFRSRAHTIKFYEFLRHNGVPAEIVNTPKEAGVGCGLSVKVLKERLQTIKIALSRTELNSFAGIFKQERFGGKSIVRSI